MYFSLLNMYLLALCFKLSYCLTDRDIILVSPVHPVTEGDSVTLGCRLKIRKSLSSVFFFKNDKLIKSDTTGELNITSVSESDEGSYKCQWSGKESFESWVAVKCEYDCNYFHTCILCGIFLFHLNKLDLRIYIQNTHILMKSTANHHPLVKKHTKKDL